MEIQRTEVIEQTRDTRDHLSRFAHDLATADTTDANDCTSLAARLRRLARLIDRYAAHRPAGTPHPSDPPRATSPSRSGRKPRSPDPDTTHIWIFPGYRP